MNAPLVALCGEIVAAPVLAERVRPDTVVEMAEYIFDDATQRKRVIPLPRPTPPPSVGALRTWWRIPERERPSSGLVFRAAEWEACARERWRYGDHEGAYEAMAHAARLMRTTSPERAA